MADRLREWVLPILVVTMGMQLLRLFIGSLTWYLRDTVGLSAVSLTPYAFGTFLVALLAPLIWRLAGPRRALWISAGGVAVLRLVEQIVTDPGIDLWLSMAGIAAFLLYLPTFLGYLRATTTDAAPRWAYGFALGLTFDTALRGAFGSLDLTWIPGAVPLLVTVLISAAVLWAVWKEPVPDPEARSETTRSGAIALIAMGPFLALQLLIFQSPGLLGELSGIGSYAAFLVVMIGNLLMVVGIYYGFARPDTFRASLALAAGVYLVLAIISANLAGYAVLLTAAVSQFVLGWGWAMLSLRAAPAERTGLTRTGFMLPLGTLLFLLLVFAFYLSLDIALPFPRTAIPPATAGLFGLLLLFAARGLQAPTAAGKAIPVWVAGVLVGVPLAVWILAGPAPAPEPPTGAPVRVMTYNLHSAFGSLGRHDPEAIAQVIEDSGAQVVALQEITRDRLLDGASDLVTWLSRRLDMPIVFSGTEEPHWGNAILSSLPILAQGSGELPRDGTLLGRGYLWVEIDTGAGDPLLLINTHLHQIVEDHDVRLLQLAVLIDFWGGRPNTVLLGDLNAEPDAPEIALLEEAGLIDSWPESGSGPELTWNSADLQKRIDYIWHSRDLRGSQAETIQTLASDHLPVVAQIAVAP
ncbi:MAG: endonuclease/exonuclease/phosphatase family protein [Chloroflexi bacterium]|nr:endonuclease/exonuclease/phosphatase family protein [Chloroflexota bacterium]MCI0853267.1 endonuclease/exonuclease/phosphatase family protein [Chloroflexota bacterium]MCI0891341.1 endonuclease/exonuclease/phosphatase family protein [Chloroflexota bacterium]